jgi:hypothetical protein
MMRALILLAAVALPAAAQPASVAPWMTGERLIKLFDRTGQEEVKWENGLYTRQQLVEHLDRTSEEIGAAYIRGVHDLSEGRSWCWEPNRPKPDTLEEQAIWGLRALPKDRLKHNAADLIVAIWAAKNPCRAAARGRP